MWTAHTGEWWSRSWSEARLPVLHIHTNASWDHDLHKPISCVTLSFSAISQLLSLHKSWISDVVHCFQSCEEYCYLWSSPRVGPLNAFSGCAVILPCWAKVTNLKKWEYSSLKNVLRQNFHPSGVLHHMVLFPWVRIHKSNHVHPGIDWHPCKAHNGFGFGHMISRLLVSHNIHSQ